MSSPRGRDVLADDAGFLPDEPDVPAWPGGSPILSILSEMEFFIIAVYFCIH